MPDPRSAAIWAVDTITRGCKLATCSFCVLVSFSLLMHICFSVVGFVFFLCYCAQSIKHVFLEHLSCLISYTFSPQVLTLSPGLTQRTRAAHRFLHIRYCSGSVRQIKLAFTSFRSHVNLTFLLTYLLTYLPDYHLIISPCQYHKLSYCHTEWFQHQQFCWLCIFVGLFESKHTSLFLFYLNLSYGQLSVDV